MRTTRHSKRSITASTSSMMTELQRFVKGIGKEVEKRIRYEYPDEYDFFYLSCKYDDTQFQCSVRVKPVYNGIDVEDKDDLVIKYYEGWEIPFLAYRMEDGEFHSIIEGESLDDLDDACIDYLDAMAVFLAELYLSIDDDQDYYDAISSK